MLWWLVPTAFIMLAYVVAPMIVCMLAAWLISIAYRKVKGKTEP
jgi:hypothetical protein